MHSRLGQAGLHESVSRRPTSDTAHARQAVKPPTEKSKSTLKKAALSTLLVVLPGGVLVGLAYLIAKRYKAKKPTP